jgi:cell division septum initiation protein DivIVA
MEKVLIEQLVLIRKKLERMLRRMKQIESENEQLKDKVAKLRIEKQELSRQLELLDSQKKILNIAKGLERDPKAKQEAKLKVNEFIKEIDKCIALLQD